MISIIIPAYNRANLLGATLNSVLAQTYRNWECIVVDDGSIDYTKELMEFYYEKDPRIKYYSRPNNRKQGGNAARNYGFEKSRGEYIQWFDSDDLMVPEFLEIKVKALENNDVDFVISKSANFKDPNIDDIIHRNEHYYKFNEFEITNYNYVSQNLNWLTYDFMGKRELVNRVRFNERLRSAQEYNFFCKLTCISCSAIVIDEYLTLRRVHPVSIQQNLRNNTATIPLAQFKVLSETLFEIYDSTSTDVSNYLLHNALRYTISKQVSPKLYLAFVKYFMAKGQFKIARLYFLFQTSFYIFSKGYKYRRRFIAAYNKEYFEKGYTF